MIFLRLGFTIHDLLTVHCTVYLCMRNIVLAALRSSTWHCGTTNTVEKLEG